MCVSATGPTTVGLRRCSGTPTRWTSYRDGQLQNLRTKKCLTVLGNGVKLAKFDFVKPYSKAQLWRAVRAL